MKLAFVEKLSELATQDWRIVLLTGDLGFQIFDGFRTEHGARYVNVGVAEAQMICMAAGLAHEGFRPFAYSIASFVTARCYEQVKLSVAYPGLPVVIVGAGGGYAYGASGVTHHAGDDLALMRIIPKMTVVAPADASEARQLLPQVLDLDGPCYFRIGRGCEPQYSVKAPCVLGQGRLLFDGEDVAVLGTGEVGYEVFSAVQKLREHGIFPVAYQFHTVSPLDNDVLEALATGVSTIIIAEEHVDAGGFASAVREWLSKRNHSTRVIGLGVPDLLPLGNPTQSEIRSRYGFDSESIAAAVVRSLDLSRRHFWHSTLHHGRNRVSC